MKFLSDILAKAGLTVDGVVTLNNTATGQTPAANDNSTKLATTAWVRTFVQPYSLPIASASVLGGIKVGTGLSIDAITGVLSAVAGGSASIKSTQTFTATAGQTVFTITGGYTVGLIDVFLNGVYLSPNQTTATNGTTVTLGEAAAAGDIIDVIIASPVYQGATTTTDQLPEGVVNLYYTNARARAAISLTVTGTSGASTYDSATGVLNVPTYTLAGLGGVPTGRTITIDGVSYDLSANRTWNILPTGGATGDILAKSSATNYDVAWIPNYTSQVQHQVKLGATMTAGTAVYVSSSTGNAGTNMIVSKASNAAEGTSSKTLGLIATGGVTNDTVFVVTEGLLAGLDTSTAAAGDPVWLGVNGALIFGLLNKPVAPAHLVFIGVVTRAQQNNGEIFVKVQNGFELDELHDLSVKNASDGDMIKYVASTGLWTKIAATTTNITEGTNLYYTQARFDSAFSAKSTTNLSEGTNLYYTQSRFDTAFAAKSTTNLAEGTNLYYTTARFDTRLATKSTTDLAEGTNLYYTTVRVNSDFDTRLATKSTSNLAEGTNLYYTDARVSSYLTTNSYATQSYVSTQINNLVSGAPGLLDTLDELAAALGDDPNFASTISTALSNRLRIDIGTQGLTSTQQGYGRTNLGLGSLATLSSIGNAYITDLAWSKLSGTPTTIAGYGITDSLVYTTSTYSNPAWITALAWSKITGAPAFLTSYTETDTLANVTSRGATTSTAVTFSGGASISSLLINGAPSIAEASLAIGAMGVDEGGQLVLNKATSWTYAGHIDIWHDNLRFLYGTNTTTSGVAMAVNLSTRQFILPGYTATSSFTGTAAGVLAFDSSGNILTIAVPGGSVSSVNAGTGVSVNQNTGAVTVSIGQSVATSATPSFDKVFLTNNGSGTNLKVGDDVWIGDVNQTNTLGIVGQQDSTSGYISFGSDYATKLGRTGTGALTWNGNNVYHAGNLTNLNQLTNGPGYITGITSSNVTTALGFTPYNSTNPNGYISSYTETSTLAQVTARGASTSTTLNLDGRVNIGNGLTRPSALNSDSVAHARIGGADVHLFIASLGAGGGYKVAVQSARTSDFASFGLDLQANGGTLFYGGNEIATRTWVTSQSYLTSYTETDTLASVTSRGASTSTNLSFTGSLSFGSATRQMINLWSTYYGLGVQSSTLYFRTDGRFSWFSGGSHTDTENNAGGGTISMTLTGAGVLYPTGGVNAGSGNEVLGLFGMGASWRYGMGVTGAYTALYAHNSGNGVRIGYYDGTTFTPRMTIPNSGAPLIDSNTIIHSGNISSYAISAGGSWGADLVSNGWVRQVGLAYASGEWVVLTKDGQVSTLIDGTYFAGEQGGFYSLNSSNQYASRVGFYNNGGVAAFNATITTSGYLRTAGAPTNTVYWASAGQSADFGNMLGQGTSSRTVMFRGAGSSASVWWGGVDGNGTTYPFGAIDATPGEFTFWRNSGGTGGGSWTNIMTMNASGLTMVNGNFIGNVTGNVSGSAGSLSSMNISQFTNNSGYLTSLYGWTNSPDSWYGIGQSTSASGATAVGGYYPWVLSYHTGLAFSAHSAYGGLRFYNQNYPTGPLASTPVLQIIDYTLKVNGTVTMNGNNLSGAGTITTSNLYPSSYTEFGFSNTNAVQWPVVRFGPADTANGWDEGIIKASTSEGVFGRYGMGIHFNSARAFGIYSSGWLKVFGFKSDGNQSFVNLTVPTLNGFSIAQSDQGTTSLHSKIPVFSSTGNLSTVNPESYSGEVRLGAAWSRGGVYASSTLSMSTSSGNINFVSNDTVIGGFRWDSSNGTRFIVGLDSNIQTPYTLIDANKRPVMYARGAYPVLVLDHTETSNTNHGPTIQFAFNGLDSRQWVIGASGNGSRLDFGMSNAAYSNTNYNPHNGIAGYQGKTVMRITEGGVAIGSLGTYPTINSPAYELDVRGNMRATGIIYANSYLVTPTIYSGGGSVSFGNNVSITPSSASWAEGLAFSMSSTGTWGGLRWRRERGNNDGNWYIGFTALDSTDDLVFGANNGGTQVDNIIRLTKAGNVTLGGSGGTTYITTQLNIYRHIDSYVAWGSCTSIFVGWSSQKVVLGNNNNGGHDYAYNMGCSSVVSTNPFYCYQDITAYSDARVKDNVEVVNDAIEKIKLIRGVTFTRNDIPDTKKRHAGVIAQEVLAVLPEVVTEDNRGHYSVAYGNLTSLLIEGIKEQQSQIESQKTEIEELKDLVKQLLNR